MTEKSIHGIIYILHNLETDSKYIGSTKLPNTTLRLMGHYLASTQKSKQNIPIVKAMNSIGIEKFYIEEIERGEYRDKKELLQREKHFIMLYDTVNNGYNRNNSCRN